MQDGAATATPRGDRAPGPRASRTHDPERTRQGILAVATEEFARGGLSGARIDEITARTRTSKGVIYYHFGSKEGLYQAVLEAEYRRIRTQESQLGLNRLAPLDALRALVGFTFDFNHRNETFVRLVAMENVQQGAFLGDLTAIRQLSTAMVEEIRGFYGRGVAQGVFRPGIDPLELHWQISALCFFAVSNRPTFSRLFGLDPGDAAAQARRREGVLEMVERYVAA
ncbi:TetR family transcriptional regulator [Roseomonas sp. OT10]|uniref:TetR/AcrR family transcriptional regulator n=1 Tax=Roseomonas cutis TaxID=2897332 RepID=UPI001E303E12|nr:TetR/AcrR family transcriptional regulator [Roseomonas sp. OT10]UFN48879.1 TetR family transcriptional regulator [Roseomonas sp. OT10]